jgi:hypothetical protein
MSDLGKAVDAYIAGLILVAVVGGAVAGGVIVFLMPYLVRFIVAHVSLH